MYCRTGWDIDADNHKDINQNNFVLVQDPVKQNAE